MAGRAQCLVDRRLGRVRPASRERTGGGEPADPERARAAGRQRLADLKAMLGG